MVVLISMVTVTNETWFMRGETEFQLQLFVCLSAGFRDDSLRPKPDDQERIKQERSSERIGGNNFPGYFERRRKW